MGLVSDSDFCLENSINNE